MRPAPHGELDGPNVVMVTGVHAALGGHTRLVEMGNGVRVGLCLDFSRRGSAMTDERAVVQLGHCLAQLFLRVHDDGSVPRNGLFERLTRDEQKANALGTGLDNDLIAAVEEDERMVARVVNGIGIGVDC